jgi:hypothetical protein
VHNESDIWAFTKLPTLAVVSYINDLAPPRAASKRRRLFSRPAKSMGSVRG